MSTAGNKRRLRRGAALAFVSAVAGGSLLAVNAAAGADQTQTPDPTAVIFGADSADAIAGEYLVVLEDEAPQGVSAMVSNATGSVEAVEEFEVIDGFIAEMSPEEAVELASDEAVAYVEQNRTVSIAEIQTDPPSWGLDRVDQATLPLDEVYEYDYTGAGTTAYILDTGINRDHADFTDRIGEGYDAIDFGGDASDCNGHGTHVAGTIGGTSYGLAKETTLVPVRVLDCTGTGSYAGIISGIDWIAANASGPSVANMSLGGTFSQALNDVVAEAVDAGVTFVAASGNEGQDACDVSPASEPVAITVGATDAADSAAAWSNWGGCVDIMAPGAEITSAWIDDTEEHTASGTSMAAPHVAGAAALYLETDPEATPAEVAEALIANAVPDVLGETNGSPNLLLNTEFLATE